ncbi:NAD(P)H-binding protein [Labilibaculum antarcticum]|uniref:NAD(P)-dependent oxidoreductase n=1 Tax=Labilibaculum antarcticum TaxID=1717717 RepID=A0A1Y1CPC7_9BACT|nr:NAD(P)H-binding protein [Labilibaculum antarcticum]BAX82104.1 NAD(P)-dependent oxidoreductase [Labilibaculum antarcticum]
MKIAVTTASGNLGRAIVKKAIAEFGKENIIGLARTPEKAADLGIEIRKGDYNNPKDFEEALKGIDVVVILSGNDEPEKRILQHRNIINGAKTAGVQKIIYTSIFGDEGKCAFDSVIKSNRQTEKDIMECGLQYAIGRNGLYLEPDIDCIGEYVKAGEIKNSGGDGRCAYATREELAFAYVSMIKKDSLNGGVYNLFGECVTQQELTNAINKVYGTNLKYHEVSVEEYKQDRTNVYGDFFGNVIAGIYEGIRNGAFDLVSDFETVTGRKHQSFLDSIEESK